MHLMDDLRPTTPSGGLPPESPLSRRRHDRSAATVVIAATLASVLWCGFNLAGLRMDLFYTALCQK